MTVKELIKILQQSEPDLEVIVSMDAEGNGYSALDEIVHIGWNEDDKQIGFLEMTDQLRDEGYNEEDMIDGVPAIVLYRV